MGSYGLRFCKVSVSEIVMNAIANKVFLAQVEAEIVAIHSGCEVWDLETKTLLSVIE